MQDIKSRTPLTEKQHISFIIAYYNLPVKMLTECIDSILALSLRPSEREIIVVDDGSDNSPVNALMQYGEDVIYVRQANKGLSEARNTGIQMATGVYLQFIDGDDLLLHAPYEHCLDILRFSQPEMVIFDFTHKDNENIEYTDSNVMRGSDYMRHQNIRGTACGYIFSRSILGNLRFTPGIYHEDEEFTPQLLLRAEAICETTAKAYLYRKHPDSITTQRHIKMRLRRLEDIKGIIFRLNIMADRLPTDDKSAMQRRVAQLTMDYLYQIIRQTGSQHYLERKMEELRAKGLFPLPDRDYTLKYKWFRKLSESPRGIGILMRFIPLIRKER